MKRYPAIVILGAIAAAAGCGGASEEEAREAPAATMGAPAEAGEEADAAEAALSPEPIPNVLSLPEDYPDSWFFAHDVNFFNLVDGKIVILDAAAETREYKGQLPAGSAGSFAQSWTRGELYVAETIHELRVRGPRHDYLMVYDVATLEPLAEIELPPKRYQGMPYRSALVLIDDDSLALVYNFTPAASVTVVDLERRSVLSEVPIPGCAMIFPTGQRGFSTLCGDGRMTSIALDESGAVATQTKTEPFFDPDDNALFMASAEHDGIYYFPTFLGDMQPIDLSSGQPKVLESWPLLSRGERSENWRPGGWQLITADAEGELYILIHPDGAEGTHKNPSGQIWVYSPDRKSRTRTIELKKPAISIEATKGQTPFLVALNTDLEIDIYDAKSGEWLRKFGGLATETAFAFYAVE